MIAVFAVAASVWMVLCSWVAERLWGRPPFTGLDGLSGHRMPGAEPYSRGGG